MVDSEEVTDSETGWFLQWLEAEYFKTVEHKCWMCGARYSHVEWITFLKDGAEQCCPKPVYGPPKPLLGLSEIVISEEEILSTYRNIRRG